MKPALQLKTTQQLVLTPQLQQAIRLLQLSSLELQTEIEQILLDNPLLERDETNVYDSTQSDTIPNTSTLDAEIWGHHSDWVYEGNEGLDPLLNIPCPTSLRHHLLGQLSELALSPRESSIVHLLIEELDERGYLSRSLAEIAADLPLGLAVADAELEMGLQCLHHFEPAGVGARNLSESLYLQLQSRDTGAPEYALALQIVQCHLALLANRDYTKLKNICNVDEEALRQAQDLIARLSPMPAVGFGADPVQYVVPELSVRQYQGRWIAKLNHHAVPRLKVQQAYAQVLSGACAKDDALLTRLQEARWLIKSMQQRFDTILKVAEAIVHKQQLFFEQGEQAMQPLVLRDIADELGLHESTVSRVTAQKYLACPRGIFELKYFFGAGLQTAGGVIHSATAVKSHIRALIGQESSRMPLSDHAISVALAMQGIQVARRTVAKYREAMLIPAANLRKAL